MSRDHSELTLAVHGQINFADGTIGAEDLTQVSFVDVLGQFFHNDLA